MKIKEGEQRDILENTIESLQTQKESAFGATWRKRRKEGEGESTAKTLDDKTPAGAKWEFFNVSTDRKQLKHGIIILPNAHFFALELQIDVLLGVSFKLRKQCSFFRDDSNKMLKA